MSKLDTIDNKMWGLMNRCWTHDDTKRPSCQHLLEELGSFTLPTNDIDESYEGVGFQATMTKCQSTSTDVSNIEEILRTVSCYETRTLVEMNNARFA